MGAFDLPTQHVICPKCGDDYYSDGKKQSCPYCKHKFVIGKDDKK